ncbi:oxygenase MpaB family protein [Arthrobacter cupressi]|uniref:Uncharacterized conserved protein, DUF2236 family n=1 Tax=Arthrobacter cupressi TaxID=1045773 RepID=A0A1G8VVZ7_9MICC|nr:oxygenase MpaB family protein [Arthrobacter cupressi]NYD78598.1 uncharacterized protein (DUF2236 family) [Arthrobacter cupressi]SDJ70106.1 Uncharacterized conserved protein, DUF2236 family [Arthrobacter cupressi]
MDSFIRKWRGDLRTTFTGHPLAVPDWVLELADGDDPGYHRPGSAVWAVHGSVATIISGIRVLLMQSLHPGALAGVYDHSAFQQDPLGRLAGTIRWIFTVSYGSEAAARQATAKVRQVHRFVHGTYVDNHGAPRSYSARDPELLGWVHAAYADSFVAVHRVWGGAIPGGEDAYVREWAQAGRLMGVIGPPETLAEVKEEMDRWYYSGELRADARLRETVEFIRNPPLAPSLRGGYRVLFNAAVASLEPRYRELLGLRTPRLGPVPLPIVLPAKAVLAVVRLGLGRQSSSEKAARARLRRLGYAA